MSLYLSNSLEKKKNTADLYLHGPAHIVNCQLNSSLTLIKLQSGDVGVDHMISQMHTESVA